MSNSYFDFPSFATADRFVKFDVVRSSDVNDALDLVSAGFEKLPTPAQVWGGTQNYATAGGSTDAWTATIAATYLTSYTDGMEVRIKFTAANTATAPTLNLNALGAKTIVSAAGSALAAGDIAANAIATLIYNSTLGKFQLASQEAVDVSGFPTFTSKSADYTFVLGDADNEFLHPSADTTPRTWTIPANASVSFSVGTTLTFYNQASAGALTIAITTDTMRMAGPGTTGSRTLAANGAATAVKLSSTEWIISGTGLT